MVRWTSFYIWYSILTSHQSWSSMRIGHFVWLLMECYKINTKDRAGWVSIYLCWEFILCLWLGIHDYWRSKNHVCWVVKGAFAGKKLCCIRNLSVSVLEESGQLKLSSVLHILAWHPKFFSSFLIIRSNLLWKISSIYHLRILLSIALK